MELLVWFDLVSVCEEKKKREDEREKKREDEREIERENEEK